MSGYLNIDLVGIITRTAVSRCRYAVIG